MRQYFTEAFELVVLIAAGITVVHGPVRDVWTFAAWVLLLSFGAGLVSVCLLPFAVLIRMLARMVFGGAEAVRTFRARGLAPDAGYDGLDARGERPHVPNGGR